MRKFILSLVIASLCAPTWASAAESFTSFDRAPQLNLYVKVNMGSNRNQFAKPIFGLSLNRELSPQSMLLANNFSDSFADYSALQLGFRRSVPVLDFQFDRHGSRALQLGGAKLAASGDEPTIWQNPWLWIAIGVGALAISCGTDHFPCSGGGHSGMGGGGGGY